MQHIYSCQAISAAFNFTRRLVKLLLASGNIKIPKGIGHLRARTLLFFFCTFYLENGKSVELRHELAESALRVRVSVMQENRRKLALC